MAVYTKRGDRGKTSTFKGKKVSKSSKLIVAIGAIDELNSFLGIVGNLKEIQKKLFTINAILTGAKLSIEKSDIKELEKEIDKIENKLPVLQNFIIYGGSQRATKLYYARALCRRAEREVVSLSEQKKVLPEILTYLNRLSDYLFMLARLANFQKKVKETLWS